jgi:HK97 family phage major capsid protein
MELNTPQCTAHEAAFEAKAEIGHDPLLIAGVNAAFAAYRDANDQRLAEIERRASADVLLEEKVARIDAALDQHMRRIDRALIETKRPPLAGAAPAHERERKSGFDAYMRRGETRALSELEGKQLSAATGADGGFVAPAEVERAILERLAVLSPMRQIASVRAVSAGSYRLAVAVTNPAVGWVAETAARPGTDTPDLAQLTFPVMELYAMPAATQALLDDAVVDIDAWVAGEVETVFAEQESTAFISGNGTTQPLGVLSAPVVADASWSWGNIGVLNSGAAGAFAASNPSDVLVDLVYALRAGYRQNGVFMMNRRTQSTIRKFKDSTGAYLWTPPASLGQPATLMNFPVVEMEAMPAIAANSVSILFGDFKRGYLIVDRLGVRVLRDPYTAKPFVLFYTTKRVGGGVQDFAAIKGLRFAA